MRDRGITDPDDLFIACEDLIEGANLFESYDSPGEHLPERAGSRSGLPVPSIGGYIALREHYGDEWPARDEAVHRPPWHREAREGPGRKTPANCSIARGSASSTTRLGTLPLRRLMATGATSGLGVLPR